MSPSSENPEHERQLLAAAKRGDEGAFEGLVQPYRGELQAHAYRMVGSLHDAEDATQEAMLRAWRGIGRFEGRSSLRTWLYTITTNSSLRLIERRPKRVLPIEFGPPADPHEPTGKPLVEQVCIEPYPDGRLADEGTETSPETRYQQRESVELAFTAAMQPLPPVYQPEIAAQAIVWMAEHPRQVHAGDGLRLVEHLRLTAEAADHRRPARHRIVDHHPP